MIYTYTYTPHRIEGFHRQISCFFQRLFETDSADFDENILCEREFIPIVNASKVRLKEKMKTLCCKYHSLSEEEKKKVRKAFEVNNRIEEVCGNKSLHPVKYEEISEKIRQDLKDFCMMLWKEYPQNKLIGQTFGTLQEHFNQFKQLEGNQLSLCPFCGLQALKPPTESDEDKNRDSYDHIAPEALYPFVSVNFKNLVPVCKECNSDEKKATDTFYGSDGNRRVVLYPYASSYVREQLAVEITSHEVYNEVTFRTLLKDIDWDIAIRMAGKEEEFLDTWDQIYHIKERYKKYLKVQEEEWFRYIVEKYKRSTGKGESWTAIKDDILWEVKARIGRPLGILEYVYDNYMLSMDSLQKYLETMYPISK